MNDSEILVRVEGVSKKFCRSLKKSLWYGVKDMAAELLPIGRSETTGRQDHGTARPQDHGTTGRQDHKTSPVVRSPLSSSPSPAVSGQKSEPTSDLRPPTSGPVPTSDLRPLTSDGDLRSGEFYAVRDVSFELKRGECLGLIGHNGAGKTTLLKMLNGLIKPDHGRIEMRGRVGALIALGAGFNPILTGRENIYVNGSVLGLTKREIDAKIEDIIDFADIREFIDSPVQSYSSGMQVRLGFAVATALDPDILLLDEVLAVGDMAFQAKCFNRLGEVRQRGTGFILVSHNMHQITRFCDRVVYMQKGKIESIGETGKVVGMFLKEMASHGEFKEPEMVGTLEVVVKDAFYTNQSGSRVSEITCREPVNLVVEFECKNGPVSEPVMEIMLRDAEGNALYHGSSSMAGSSLGELRDKGILTVSFPAIPANNQQLTTAIALWDSGMQKLFCWRRGLKLSVLGNAKSTGCIMVDCQWQRGRLHEI